MGEEASRLTGKASWQRLETSLPRLQGRNRVAPRSDGKCGKGRFYANDL